MKANINDIKNELEKINSNLNGIELYMKSDYIEPDDNQLDISIRPKGIVSIIPKSCFGEIEISEFNVYINIFNGGAPMNINIVTDNEAENIRKLSEAMKLIADDREVIEENRNNLTKLVSFD